MRNQGGFTLIELILVVVILGILAGSVVPVYKGQVRRAMINRAKQDISAFGTQVDLYALEHNDQYPDSLQDLASGKKKYVKEVVNDPWGNTYVYKKNDESYEIFSVGPDGQAGNGDDVTSSSVQE